MNRLLVSCLAAGTALCAHAAPFADPFRPPVIREPVNTSRTASAGSATRLESLLIGPDRRIAVINGEQYSEGAAFADGRITRITETEVVIRHPDREETLRLFPLNAKHAPGEGER